MSRIDLWTKSLYKEWLWWGFSLLCWFGLQLFRYSESVLRRSFIRIFGWLCFHWRCQDMEGKKTKGKQDCCRWVDILSNCFHVIWQEVNWSPPSHPSSPFLLPSHRLLMMFCKGRLGSWGVPQKEGCFDLCWTSKQPWSLGSCLFLRILSLWWCLNKEETLYLHFWLWGVWMPVPVQIPTYPIEEGTLQVWTLAWATENERIFLLNHLCFIKYLKGNDFNSGALIKNIGKCSLMVSLMKKNLDV